MPKHTLTSAKTEILAARNNDQLDPGMALVATRQMQVRPRGICSHCTHEVALLKDGNIGSWHYPCPGTGQPPLALVERRVVPVNRAAGTGGVMATSLPSK